MLLVGNDGGGRPGHDLFVAAGMAYMVNPVAALRPVDLGFAVGFALLTAATALRLLPARRPAARLRGAAAHAVMEASMAAMFLLTP